MKHSIRKQFALIFIGLLTGMILLFWFLNNTFLERYYIMSKAHTMDSVYEKIYRAAGTEDGVNLVALQDLTANYIKENVMVAVVDTDAKIVYLSPNGGSNFIYVIQDLIRRYGEDEIVLFPHQNTNYMGRFGMMANGNSYVICTPLESILESVAVSNRFLAYTGIVMVIIGGVIIWMVTRKITDPILQLAKISERMAKLDFDARYQGNTGNEIELLGDNINRLADSLEKNISELKTVNNELKRDIEKKEQIDEMRREFLANVSHELKTPIALIQGYAEGLQEGINDDPDNMRFYCEVIMDEASKMNTMVKRLMTLNQLESGNEIVTMERFDVAALIHNYVQSARILTRQNDIDVCIGEYPPIYVWADEFRTEEVFMNYFSNAVNHCMEREGKKAIEITLEKRDSLVRVNVFNTGEPIPEESVPHLWEKFYKVDKARTREYGGSGVGLSIVKAIMDSMNREYGIQNYSNGVKFWFELEMVQESEKNSEEL